MPPAAETPLPVASIIRRRDLQALLGVCSDTMRRYMRDGKLPPPDFAPTHKMQGWKVDTLKAAGFDIATAPTPEA